MNKTILNKKLLGGLLLALVLTACKSTPMANKPAGVEDKSPTTSSTTGTDANSGADTSGVKEVTIDSSATGGGALNDPNNILSKRNIYFDYDSDAIKAEYRPLIEAHAKYLLSHDSAKMVLQGNTDERGTREYNLSLGQRRSVAVKQALNQLGVQDKQIETVSYGEERATQSCADETCYQANRRVDITYERE